MRPPQTGMEPTSRSRQAPSIPGNGAAGYTDAYGNELRPIEPKVKPRKRLRPGAYGSSSHEESTLPELPDKNPLWNF